MRPLRLDIEGFGTFRDPVSLDFTDTDYFALVGPTGSGKTTVIDAICFALYGAAPRWPRRNQVSLAMAPSTSFTRVSLFFEVSGRQYAAVRALAKSARGQVTTKQSRLITLPGEMDLTGDLGELLGEELESIAETPADMEAGIERLLGLSYEHFTQSVVLPQGGFAKFLHAEKRERQDLLVSLLGLGVYERVMQLANRKAEESRTTAATLRSGLDQYADATESAEEVAADRVRTLTDFHHRLAELLAPWKLAALELEAATTKTAGQDAGLRALTAISAPDGLDSLAAERAEVTTACVNAKAAVEAAEKAEVEAEQAVGEAGQPSDWQQLIKLHRDLATTRQQQAGAAALVVETADALDKATAECERATQALDRARANLEEVRIAHAADDLAQVLVAGSECPVCRQIVATVPDRQAHQGLSDARAAVDQAEQAMKTAESTRSSAERQHDRVVTERDRLAKVRSELETSLADQPDAEAATKAYEVAVEAEKRCAAARLAARAARETQRTADEKAKIVEQRWNDAGRRLTIARDTVGRLSPPPTTGDHVEDWSSLESWAAAKIIDLRAETQEALAVQQAAASRELQQRAIVGQALSDHDVEPPDDFTEATVTSAVAVAVASAQHAVDRVRERRASAAALMKRIDDQEESEQLHRELGNLLNARNFERWMVEEALRAMMIEASETLTELSGGQFELTLDSKQDILVVDHNDASSQRPVQTLSGGETFQASLALALALSSQIAALSPNTGQLDTILLDEGFGTLDPSTLDVVASTLEQLSGGGERTVGLVTHVAALAERVPVRFEVRREGSRSSVQKVWA